MTTYADDIATQDELLKQHGYLQRELEKYKGEDMAKKEKTDIKAVDKLLSSTLEGFTAVQNGKMEVSEETFNAMQTLIVSLCGTVSNFVQEKKENAEETA